ncbi:hypothetical protein FIBSPDRAFT_1051381 [Athelia psychrophila]|uniref:Uncharacterized protein n=1 Tax=Athelia psychrophila TaxID=1759441 RepID=A0A165ZAC5_9AGAM|nr:hypothetical protein FIBSPDRAFT_1051381 [Fibularhizoctonia sp. CBS 109695]
MSGNFSQGSGSSAPPPAESAPSSSVRPSNLPHSNCNIRRKDNNRSPRHPRNWVPNHTRLLCPVAATLSQDKTMARVLRILHLSNVSHCLTVQVGDPLAPTVQAGPDEPWLVWSSSPRLRHQHPQHPGQPPNMPPQQQQQQPMPVPGWSGHYYQQDPYMQQAY